MAYPLKNAHYPPLETDRLLLTPMALEDAEFYQQAFERSKYVGPNTLAFS